MDQLTISDCAKVENSNLSSEIFSRSSFSNMAKDLSQQNEVDNFLGTSVKGPENWERNDRIVGRSGTLITFSCPEEVAQISLLDRGHPISEKVAKDFENLLLASGRNKELTSDQIKNLSELMGSTTAGDNQFTNIFRPPDPRSPAFQVELAQLIDINGKTVLEVKGNFFNEFGLKGKEYRGIFASCGPKQRHIKEVFLQAADHASYLKHEPDYTKVLNSIKW